MAPTMKKATSVSKITTPKRGSITRFGGAGQVSNRSNDSKKDAADVKRRPTSA